MGILDNIQPQQLQFSTPQIAQKPASGFLESMAQAGSNSLLSQSNFRVENQIANSEASNIALAKKYGVDVTPLHQQYSNLGKSLMQTSVWDSNPYWQTARGTQEGLDISKKNNDIFNKLKQQYPNAGFQNYDDMKQQAIQNTGFSERDINTTNTTLGGKLGSLLGGVVESFNPNWNGYSPAVLGAIGGGASSVAGRIAINAGLGGAFNLGSDLLSNRAESQVLNQQAPNLLKDTAEGVVAGAGLGILGEGVAKVGSKLFGNEAEKTGINATKNILEPDAVNPTGVEEPATTPNEEQNTNDNATASDINNSKEPLFPVDINGKEIKFNDDDSSEEQNKEVNSALWELLDFTNNKIHRDNQDIANAKYYPKPGTPGQLPAIYGPEPIGPGNIELGNAYIAKPYGDSKLAEPRIAGDLSGITQQLDDIDGPSASNLDRWISSPDTGTTEARNNYNGTTDSLLHNIDPEVTTEYANLNNILDTLQSYMDERKLYHNIEQESPEVANAIMASRQQHDDISMQIRTLQETYNNATNKRVKAKLERNINDLEESQRTNNLHSTLLSDEQLSLKSDDDARLVESYRATKSKLNSIEPLRKRALDIASGLHSPKNEAKLTLHDMFRDFSHDDLSDYKIDRPDDLHSFLEEMHEQRMRNIESENDRLEIARQNKNGFNEVSKELNNGDIKYVNPDNREFEKPLTDKQKRQILNENRPPVSRNDIQDSSNISQGVSSNIDNDIRKELETGFGKLEDSESNLDHDKYVKVNGKNVDLDTPTEYNSDNEVTRTLRDDMKDAKEASDVVKSAQACEIHR